MLDDMGSPPAPEDLLDLQREDVRGGAIGAPFRASFNRPPEVEDPPVKRAG